MRRAVSIAVAVVLAVVLVVLAGVVGALARNGVLGGEPPGLGERLALALSSNVAAIAPDSPFPELRPGEHALDEEALLEALTQACARLGWECRRDGSDPLALRATVVTGLLRFRDDVTLAVEAGDAPGTVRVRGESRSRVGRGDLGANAHRLARLLAELEAVLSP